MGKITLPSVLRNNFTSMLTLKKRTFLFLLLTTIGFVTSTFAQDYVNEDFEITYQPTTTSAAAGVGIGPGNEAFNEVNILALGSSTNTVLLTMKLAPGVEYVDGAGSIIITASNPSGAFTVTEFDVTDASNPVFAINKGAATTNWGAGDNVSFLFLRSANCDAVVHSEAQGTFKDKAAFTYVGGDGSGEDTSDIGGTYNLIAPSLLVDGPILSVPAVVGGTHIREISDINAGNSGTVEGYHSVLIGDNVTGYQLSYNGTPLVADDPMANPLIFRYTMGVAPFDVVSDAGASFEDGNGVFNDGETLVFTEEFSLDSCGATTADTNVTHQAGWDCYLSAEGIGSVLFGAAVPNLVFTVIDNPREICETNTVVVEITNTGVGPAAFAKDVKLSFGLGSNSQLLNLDYNYNNRWPSEFYDQKIFTNFRLGVGGDQTNVSGDISGWTPDNPTYAAYGDTQVLAENTLLADPDGVGVGFDDVDGDLSFDDIPAGATVTLTYDITFVDDDVFSCSSGYDQVQDWEHIYLNALAKTQCDVTRVAGTDLGYGNLGRDYINPTLREQDTDTSDGEIFELALNPYFVNAGTAYRNNGSGLFTTGTDSEMLVELNVPAGVTLSGTAGPEFTQPAGAGTPVFYKTSDLINGYNNRNGGDDDRYIRFPLIATCATPNPILVDYKTT